MIFLAVWIWLFLGGACTAYRNNDGFEEAASACNCVPYYLCKDGMVITDGAGLINPRRRHKPSAGAAEIPGNCGDYHVCCNAPGVVDKKSTRSNCGIRRHTGVESRIASVEQSGDTTFGEWPWQGIILEYGSGSEATFKCGCVLIGPKHVLTVAHCVTKFKSVKPITLFVRLGVWDIQAEDYPLPYQDMNVSEIHIHPGYNNITLAKDIAILTFHKPVHFAPNVETICLPYHNETHVGQTCVATGWGKPSWDGKGYSRYLKRVDVPVLNRSYCQSLLRKTRLGVHFRLDRSFVCAGGIKEQDACKGDGGGPLACLREDGSYSLTGLTSWGIGCGQEDNPGVYVDVERFLRWISKTTKQPLENYWLDQKEV